MTDDDRDELVRLRQEVGALREAVQLLAYCKQVDASYAFFDWLVKNDVFDDKRTRLTKVLSVLNRRLDGEDPGPVRALAGVSTERLYERGRPSYEVARSLLAQAVDKHENTVEELFAAFAAQGIQDELVALWRAAKP